MTSQLGALDCNGQGEKPMKQIETVKWNKILDPEVNLVLVPHYFPNKTTEYLNQLSNYNFSFKSWADIIKLPEHPGKMDFIHDIWTSYIRFDDLVNKQNKKRLSIRLETLTKNSCTSFHEDHGGIRLFQTLLGPTTEYVTTEVTFDKTKTESKIKSVKEGWITLIKGKNENCATGCQHKGPDIESTNKKRIVLTIE